MSKQYLIPVKDTEDANNAIARVPGVADQGDEVVVLIVSEVPEGEYTVPLGVAATVRTGSDVTVLAYGAMLYEAVDAATKAAAQGVQAEVIDLRTLWPVDIDAILASVKKTGRLVIVHEAPRTCGLGGELLSLVAERAFYHLQAPPIRVTGFDTPFPYALEMDYLPLSNRILPALLKAARAS